jgi:hypothetical protein
MRRLLFVYLLYYFPLLSPFLPKDMHMTYECMHSVHRSRFFLWNWLRKLEACACATLWTALGLLEITAIVCLFSYDSHPEQLCRE